jgi:carboxylesterase type B
MPGGKHQTPACKAMHTRARVYQHVCFLVIMAVDSAALAAPPIANTSPGLIKGIQLGLNADNTRVSVNQYMGIPFALPPTGKRRFASPEDWKMPFKGGESGALKAGSHCDSEQQQQSAGYESCLFLNIRSPAKRCSCTRTS